MPRTQLFFSVIPKVSDNDGNLTHQRDPEWRRCEWTMFEPVSDVPQSEVGEHLLSRDDWSGHDDNDGSQHLGEGKSCTDVETREGLEEDHAQTDTLSRVKNSQPEPQGNADPGSSTPCPWNVQSDGRDPPEHLDNSL